MKALTPLFLLLLALTPAAQRDSEFMSSFRQAMKIQATDEMERLVKDNVDAAVVAVLETCQEIGKRSSEQLENEIDALGKAWRKAFKSGFVDKQYEYYSLRLRGTARTDREELVRRYHIQHTAYMKVENGGDSAGLASVGLQTEGLAGAFEEIGDTYMASQSWVVVAQCFSERLAKKHADLRKACTAWGKVVELRKAAELEDAMYRSAKEFHEYLENEGYGDPEKGPEGRAKAKAASEPGYAPQPLEASFEVFPNLASVRRPNYTVDENYQMWPVVWLGKKGAEGIFNTLGEDRSPKVLRISAAQAMIDVDRDGEGDIEIPLGGNITPVELTIEEDGEERPWAFLATVGLQRDVYQGFDYNMQPDDNQMQIFIAPAASRVGMIGETPIRIIDENMDGRYGGTPLEWAYIGLRPGDYQRDVDSVLIGTEKVARPWSEYQQIGGDWYRFTTDEESGQLQYAKVDVETGTVKLDFKGVKPNWLLLRGRGKLEGAFVDLAINGKRGTEVPAGSWELYAGQVSKGKRSQMSKALVLPGQGMPGIQVPAGGKATLALGAPFGFDFEYSQDDESVEVQGHTIVVTGRGGETYQRLWNCVVKPEVLLRKAGSKKGKEQGKLSPVLTQEQIADYNNDFRVAWFPITEKIAKKKAGEEVEVQLFEKKNKLFGKIESDWLQN